MKKELYVSQWQVVWEQFKQNKIGLGALIVFSLFFILALYAPFLASSKPLIVIWDGKIYFPLFRYLFYSGFFSKPIDLFFNLLMFSLPFIMFGCFFLKKQARKRFLLVCLFCQFSLFALFLSGWIKNPENVLSLKEAKLKANVDKNYYEDPLLSPISFQKTWDFELQFLSPYEKLNMLFRYILRKRQQERLLPYFANSEKQLPTLWAVDQKNETQKKEILKKILTETKENYFKARDLYPSLLEKYRPFSHEFIMAKYDLEHASKEDISAKEVRFNALVKESLNLRVPLIEARRIIETFETAVSELNCLTQKADWLEKESKKLIAIFPFFRNFHWEDDAGGSQMINRKVPWWELSRVNRKDLVASLIFGVRVSIIVGVVAVSLSLFIGICLGMLAGYFAGKTDLFICRLIEIWEAMPIFFMLLLIVAITQSKSLFLVICVLGLFGWTSKARFMRGEVLKQRTLPYVLACKSLGFKSQKIMFSHILPNAIPPILTLLPFSMMAAITSEAGLSFLGLGEEGSTSWGVLMDEGRSVFPAESYLLWPPAILLSLMLVSIALIGDALRDALDPKMRS